jgi:hypothetical protein
MAAAGLLLPCAETQVGKLVASAEQLRAIDVGKRTRAMAPRCVHPVVRGLASACAPWCLTDGLRASLTALLPHYGYGVQPPRHPGKGSIGRRVRTLGKGEDGWRQQLALDHPYSNFC